MSLSNEENIEQGKKKNWLLNTFLFVGFFLIFLYFFLFAPSGNNDVILHISNGTSINSITQKLEDEKAVRNDFTLKLFIKILKSGRGIISGDYLIKKNSPVWVVAWQIGRGHHNIEPVRVVIREGIDNSDIADLLAKKISSFRKDLFLAGVNDKQGYLFPDTYFFFPLDTTPEIIGKLSSNFKLQIKDLLFPITQSGKELNEIITMASILEGEAGGKEDIDVISGILWKRIEKGMPLQVDVDKSTYVTKGLPLNPLNNPGLQSINAAISPMDSPYLYYLHDKDGNVHYAVTFEEHKSNITKYLK
jgi:UPF0755 protein